MQHSEFVSLTWKDANALWVWRVEKFFNPRLFSGGGIAVLGAEKET